VAIIVESGKINRFAEIVAALEPCPFAGKVTADQVKIALGELLDIWPASIADDVLAHSLGDLAASLSRITHTERL
jgi:hypothetical protein